MTGNSAASTFQHGAVSRLLALPAAEAPEPERLALKTYSGEAITRGRLISQARDLAAQLQDEGLAPGQTVLLAAAGPELLVSLYASLLCGARLALMDVHMGPDNYRAKLRQICPDWAIADSRLLLLQEHPLLRGWLRRFRPGLPSLPYGAAGRYLATGPWMPLMRRIPYLRRWQKRPAPHPPADRRAQAELVTYTSGTLAEPKGVRHAEDAIAQSLHAISLLITERDKALATALPQYALLGLEAGLAVHLWPEGLGVEERLAFMRERGITTLMGPPSEFLPMVEAFEQAGRRLPGWIHVILGAAPVHASFLARLRDLLSPGWGGQITALYGMTECLVVAKASADEKLAYAGPGDYLGLPVPGAAIRISAGGEIEVQAPWLFAGYVGQTPLPPGYWHPTGDLGFLTKEGALILTGRAKDMIIRRGFNLYPGLYEPTLSRLPGVREAVLIGVYDEARHDEAVYLVLETGRPYPPAALRAALQSGPLSIDKEAWPDYVVQLAALPRTGRQQKTDRRALRDLLAGLPTKDLARAAEGAWPGGTSSPSYPPS